MEFKYLGNHAIIIYLHSIVAAITKHRCMIYCETEHKDPLFLSLETVTWQDSDLTQLPVLFKLSLMSTFAYLREAYFIFNGYKNCAV